MNITTIILIASFQAVFLAVLLFSKKRKNLADIILGLWLMAIGLHLFINFSGVNFGSYRLIIYNLNAGLPFLQGPFLYFYVKARALQLSKLKLLDAIHLIPFFGFVAYVQFKLNSLTASIQSSHIQIHIFDLPPIFNIVILGSVPFYVVLSFLILKNYRKQILDSFSTIDKINLKWLRYIIIGMSIEWIAVIIVFLSVKTQRLDLPGDFKHLIFMAINLFVYAIGYFGFRQTNIFSNELVDIAQSKNYNKVDESVTAGSSRKYKKSGINDDTNKMLGKLKKYMENDKPYLNENLTLPLVAETFGTSTNHLSQIINQQTGQNFFDFVNSYRVNEVKERLNDPANDVYSLLSIAYDCGFGSKASFNRIFKKFTGQTPTQYKNR